jgi:hypothetical protein
MRHAGPYDANNLARLAHPGWVKEQPGATPAFARQRRHKTHSLLASDRRCGGSPTAACNDPLDKDFQFEGVIKQKRIVRRVVVSTGQPRQGDVGWVGGRSRSSISDLEWNVVGTGRAKSASTPKKETPVRRPGLREKAALRCSFTNKNAFPNTPAKEAARQRALQTRQSCRKREWVRFF